jgi:hypothetical protein
MPAEDCRTSLRRSPFRWKVRQPERIQVNRSVNDRQGWNIRRFGQNACLSRACRTRNDQQRFGPRSAPYANLPCVPISRAGKHKMGAIYNLYLT